MKLLSVVGLLTVMVLAGCAKDGKIGNTKIWETSESTTQPKTIWRNESGSQSNPPATIWKRSDGTEVIQRDDGDKRN